MSFSEERKSYSDTRKRTSSDYVKFSEGYRTVLRILDPNAKTVYKHFIREANGGKGMGAVCPNTYDNKICPIEKSVAHLDKEDQTRREANARRRFMVNVLDRTPHTTCPKCGTLTPGKSCVSCHTALAGLDYAPLNKVKILEQGPLLFNKGLNGLDVTVKEDTGADIVDYDITFITQGSDRDRRINVIPQKVEPVKPEWLIDPETGEQQQLYDLDLLAEPTPVEEIELMLNGATIEQLNALRGIA